MSTQWKVLLQRLSTLGGAAALALGIVSPRVAESQQPEIFACYVPDVGAIYLIKLTGLPDACLSESHVEITLISPGWGLTGNSGTDGGTTNFLGTTDNQPLQFHVNGLRALRLEPNATSPNLIGGFAGNVVNTGVVGATIGGGGVSGNANQVTAEFGTVAGGQKNQAGRFSTVGGGADNSAADQATVSGGVANTAGINAVVGGGTGNKSTSTNATIAGGADNTAGGGFSFIGGGLRNETGPNGGTTVGGGFENTASGLFATVPGGRFNTALGGFSFAAGRRAKANHDGAFVWADHTEADFASTGADQFLIRASGGVGIGTDTPGSQLTVAGTVESTGGGFKFPDGTVQTTAAGGSAEGFGIVPIGSIIAWHKTLPGAPALPAGWVECNGQTLSDVNSPFDGQVIPNLNGDARFLRGGSTSGTEQTESFSAHSHNASSNSAGGHNHSGSTSSEGAHAHGGTTAGGNAMFYRTVHQAGPSNLANHQTGFAGGLFTDRTDADWSNAGHTHPFTTNTTGNHSHSLSTNTTQDHSHTISVDDNGGNETRPTNMSVVWVMRVT